MLDSNLVAYERHPPVVGPGEGRDRGAPVVDELDRPATLVLDPHEDDPGGVARGQLLVRLVPSHQGHLGKIEIFLQSLIHTISSTRTTVQTAYETKVLGQVCI